MTTPTLQNRLELLTKIKEFPTTIVRQIDQRMVDGDNWNKGYIDTLSTDMLEALHTILSQVKQMTHTDFLFNEMIRNKVL